MPTCFLVRSGGPCPGTVIVTPWPWNWRWLVFFPAFRVKPLARSQRSSCLRVTSAATLDPAGEQLSQSVVYGAVARQRRLRVHRGTAREVRHPPAGFCQDDLRGGDVPRAVAHIDDGLHSACSKRGVRVEVQEARIV